MMSPGNGAGHLPKHKFEQVVEGAPYSVQQSPPLRAVLSNLHCCVKGTQIETHLA